MGSPWGGENSWALSSSPDPAVRYSLEKRNIKLVLPIYPTAVILVSPLLRAVAKREIQRITDIIQRCILQLVFLPWDTDNGAGL